MPARARHSEELGRTEATDAAARHALGRGERVLTWSHGRLVKLILDEQDRSVEIPRPNLVKPPASPLRSGSGRCSVARDPK